MSENQQDLETSGEAHAIAPDKALTVAANRLVGSVLCTNCGTALQGPFCHYCGQPDKNMLRFFPVLMRELLEDFLDFDSRFMRTIKPLLFRPGQLTRDYLDGKRFRYVPPLRLYLFSSIVFFFLAALMAKDAMEINGESGDTGKIVTGLQIGDTDPEELNEALEGLPPEAAEKIENAVRKVEQAYSEEGASLKVEEPNSEEGEHPSDDINFTVDGKPWDRETNPMTIPLMPDWVNDWVNNEIEESPQKGQEITANPDLIKDKVFEVMPATMFVLLPIVALLFKFWYLFAQRFYVEHLIFALHNHSFIFVAFLFSMTLSAVARWLEPVESGPANAAAEFVTAVIFIWIPIYLLLSLKRVYQQGWGMTLTKYLLIGSSYTLLLALATAFVALLSFVLL